MNKFLLFCFFSLATNYSEAQPYSKDVLTANQRKMYSNVVKNSILGNLDKALGQATEENWEQALSAMTILQYKTAYTQSKIEEAVTHISANSIHFNNALLRYLLGSEMFQYNSNIQNLLESKDDNISLLSLEYSLRADTTEANRIRLKKFLEQRIKNDTISPGYTLAFQKIFTQLNFPVSIKPLLGLGFQPGKTIVIALMNKNRDFPGLVLIRDTAGNLVRTTAGLPFAQPILGRSFSNIPYYFSSGNTPQGFFRMKNFAVSRTSFIGPTPNVQLSMPGEKMPAFFLRDSTVMDSVFTKKMYQNFLPFFLRDNPAVYESFEAGKLGRTEIILHGSTVQPNYYKNKSFFPFTPTEGCLTSKENWNGNTGFYDNSDQAVLNSKIKEAGGADGYLLVLDIQNTRTPVQLADVLFLFR